MSKQDASGEICPPTRTYIPTPRRNAVKSRFRRWKRQRGRWAGEATLSGERYLAALDAGHARPYELGELRRELGRVLSPRALELFAHAAAVDRGFKKPGGLRIEHALTARVLRCSDRTAQDTWHELVEHGLIEQRPWFRIRTPQERRSPREAKYFETRHRYTLTPLARAVLDERRCDRRRSGRVGGTATPAVAVAENEDGNVCHPGRTERFLPEPPDRCPVRPERPGRSFVRSVLASRRPTPTAGVTEAATVQVTSLLPGGRMSLSDGRVIASPGRTPAEWRELGRRRAAGAGQDTLEGAIASALEAFERMVGQRSGGAQ